MESFASASSSSLTGPSGSFLQECSIKEYASDFMESIDLSSVSPYDFIPLDFASFQQGLIKTYLSAVESANSRNVGAGIVAAAFLYGSWKASRVWTNRADGEPTNEYNDRSVRKRDGVRRKDYGNHAGSKVMFSSLAERYAETKKSAYPDHMSQTKPTGTEDPVSMSVNFQRQLKNAMTNLDDVKFRIKKLENDKVFMNAEIDARKQMIHKLQEENSCEREKRQQAELKMEMMSMEYSQINQLRKEVSVKSAHVERLEKLMTEKDDLQIKLFSENVVLPRSVVEARAKEFGELQNRVHQLQAEIDSARRFREFDVGCKPCRFASSVWLQEGSLSLPVPHLSEIQVSPKKSYQTDTSVALPESIIKKLPNTKLTFAKRSPVVTRQTAKPVDKASAESRSTTCASVALPNKTSLDVKYVRDQKDYQSASNQSPTTSNSFGDLKGSASVRPKNIGLFAQVRSLIGGFRDNSLDCDPANLALLTDLGTLLSSKRPNRSLKQIRENSSDEKSNSFISTVSASDGSDSDHTRLHGVCTRKSQSKKALPLKRLSRYRRDKRKDGALLKRKLAVQYFDGQARLIGLGESPTLQSVSRELTHTSTMRRIPLLTKAQSNSHNYAGSIGDHHNTNLPAVKRCDQHPARGGDSWILIIPKDTKRE